MELDLPPGTWVSLISRDDRYLVPQGPTVLERGDRLTVLATPTESARIKTSFARRP